MSDLGERPAVRRSRLVSVAAVTTVLAVIGVTNVLAASGKATLGTTLPDPVPTAPPTRVVGFGHAAITVPKVWGTNISRCGTPRKDTVLIDDPSGAKYCRLLRPDDVDSVELTATPSVGFRADERFRIDGVPAERQRTTCAGRGVCWGAVSIPSEQVWFRAESSTSSDEVDQILARIHVVPDQVGVPSYQALGERPTGTAYTAELERLGLKVKLTSRTSTIYPKGMLYAVSPAPGTMLEVGSVVTVTLIR